METNRLSLNCLLWPFLVCHCLFRRSSSTMLHSLELSGMCSSTVLNTIDRLPCLVLFLESNVTVGVWAPKQYCCCHKKSSFRYRFSPKMAFFINFKANDLTKLLHYSLHFHYNISITILKPLVLGSDFILTMCQTHSFTRLSCKMFSAQLYILSLTSLVRQRFIIGTLFYAETHLCDC